MARCYLVEQGFYSVDINVRIDVNKMYQAVVIFTLSHLNHL